MVKGIKSEEIDIKGGEEVFLRPKIDIPAFLKPYNVFQERTLFQSTRI